MFLTRLLQTHNHKVNKDVFLTYLSNYDIDRKELFK